MVCPGDWSARPSDPVPPSYSTPTCHPALLSPQQQEPGATQLHCCSRDYGRPHAYSTQNVLPFPSRPAPHCPLRAPGSTFPGLCGLRQSADYCSMLETSLHSPRHSQIIRNTCATLTRTPQRRSCFSKAPVLLVPRCDGRHALRARAHKRPLKSLPPSASWYGLWLTLKQGQGVF